MRAMVILAVFAFGSSIELRCTGPAMDDERTTLIQKLEPLKEYAFIISNKPSFNYTIHMCNHGKNAAVIQSPLNDPQHQTVLGRSNMTSVVDGTDWMLLEFGGGDNYTESDCAGKPRKAKVMMKCKPGVLHGSVQHLVESSGKDMSNCFYLFEFETKLVCEKAPSEDSTSWFTIIILLLVVGVALYLAIGISVQRFMYGARGWEQIPNIQFWSLIVLNATTLWSEIKEAVNKRTTDVNSNNYTSIRSDTPAFEDSSPNDERLLNI